MEEVVEQAAHVTNDGGGYTFAVFVLSVILVALGAALVALWKENKKWKADYIALASGTAKILTEVNVKLDGQDALKGKIDQMQRTIDTKSGCAYVG
jgi:hypothetical protein